MGAGIVQELVERLAELRQAAPRRATVVVPLKPGAIDHVRELVAHGPPFDPVETALTRHQLLLTPEEAIFVFEAQTEEGLTALLSELDIWAAAVAWHDLARRAGDRARALGIRKKTAANPQTVCARTPMGAPRVGPTFVM